MNPISGNFPGNFDPSQIQQKMTDRFNSADADGDGAVSKTEMQDMLVANGKDPAKADKIFDKLDVDGDGAISSEEHQHMLEHIQARMEHRRGGHDGASNPLDSVKTLLESLAENNDNPEQSEQLASLLEQLELEGLTGATLAQTFTLLNTIVPAIETQA